MLFYHSSGKITKTLLHQRAGFGSLISSGIQVSVTVAVGDPTHLSSLFCTCMHINYFLMFQFQYGEMAEQIGLNAH